MRSLPETIVALDGSQNVIRRYMREPLDSPRMKERDYDQLLVKHKDVLADLLVSAEVIAADSSLRVLGRQVEGIDVLLAEVRRTDQEFRRLVLVEDKLLRNPQARRQVLAQVLEYASKIHHDLTADELLDALEEGEAEWVKHNRTEIEDSLRAGDVLLLICGDDIHPRLDRLLEGIGKRKDLLSGYDLCLVSLALYKGESEELLVPNVVGLVVRAERGLVIRVVVQDAQGRGLPSTASLEPVEVQSDSGKGDVGEFLADWERKYGADARKACEGVLDVLTREGVDGLWRSKTWGGRPTIHLTTVRVKRVKILQVATSGPYIRDTLENLRQRFADEAPVTEAIRQFRRALREGIPGATRKGIKEYVYLPVTELRQRPAILAKAVKDLASALQ